MDQNRYGSTLRDMLITDIKIQEEVKAKFNKIIRRMTFISIGVIIILALVIIKAVSKKMVFSAKKVKVFLFR